MILSILKLLLIKFHSCLLVLYRLFLLSYLETRNTAKGLRYAKLPGDVKAARSVCKTAFDSWNKHDLPSGGDTHDTYRCTHKEYRLLLRTFLDLLKQF